MFTYLRTLRLADTDAAGVVYFAALLSICHEAYEAFLEAQGISLGAVLRQPNLAVPIVHADIDFLRPLHCGDRLAIELGIQRLGQSRFDSHYRVYLIIQPNLTVAQASLTHVCIDPTQGQAIPLPEVWRQMLTVTTITTSRDPNHCQG